MLRGRPAVRLHLPAAQQNSVLLRHTESVNNRLNHKGHPLFYFSSSRSTLIMQQCYIQSGHVVIQYIEFLHFQFYMECKMSLLVIVEKRGKMMLQFWRYVVYTIDGMMV